MKVFESNDFKTAKTVSQVMSTIMLRGGFNVWPELLTFLTLNIDTAPLAEAGDHQQALERIGIAIHTIAIIVEDCTKLFEEIKFRNVVTQMFPPICRLIQPQFSEEIVQTAINTVNMLLLTNTDIIVQSMDDYLN